MENYTRRAVISIPQDIYLGEKMYEIFNMLEATILVIDFNELNNTFDIIVTSRFLEESLEGLPQKRISINKDNGILLSAEFIAVD